MTAINELATCRYKQIIKDYKPFHHFYCTYIMGVFIMISNCFFNFFRKRSPHHPSILKGRRKPQIRYINCKLFWKEHFEFDIQYISVILNGKWSKTQSRHIILHPITIYISYSEAECRARKTEANSVSQRKPQSKPFIWIDDNLRFNQLGYIIDKRVKSESFFSIHQESGNGAGDTVVRFKKCCGLSFPLFTTPPTWYH